MPDLAGSHRMPGWACRFAGAAMAEVTVSVRPRPLLPPAASNTMRSSMYVGSAMKIAWAAPCTAVGSVPALLQRALGASARHMSGAIEVAFDDKPPAPRRASRSMGVGQLADQSNANVHMAHAAAQSKAA